ncbi:hypothetical protein [Paenibacillus lentus]|uniref:Thioredoxin-like fold domain-containing protein n=1 Tax=Paenibacillus lentus TaxID=1338368 RepID=A0A3Q8S3J1_9BACL|nr:hypothetical protein [Paenibacillus lentus]AZK45106.1 hypothetical protein EIM92_01945 [Paenibacillus lentus]
MKKVYMTLLPLLIIVLGSIVIEKNISRDFGAKESVQVDEDINDYFTTKIDDINKLKSGEIIGYVYFGRDTCPVCLYLNKLLEKEYEKNGELLTQLSQSENRLTCLM